MKGNDSSGTCSMHGGYEKLFKVQVQLSEGSVHLRRLRVGERKITKINLKYSSSLV
jgi:hypothetical protein